MSFPVKRPQKFPRNLPIRVKGTDYRSISEDVSVRAGHVLLANTGASTRLLIKTGNNKFSETDQYGLGLTLTSQAD